MMGYSSGEQPGSADSIKLNTNENPYPPSPKVLKAGTKFRYNNLRLYPDGNADGNRNNTWKALSDPSSGRTYYVNIATKATSWSLPPDATLISSHSSRRAMEF